MPQLDPRSARSRWARRKWQTIWQQVLPAAVPGIATGSILALSRAIGEAAPLLLLGALAFITFNPDGVLSQFTVLPVQIYDCHQAAAARSSMPWRRPRSSSCS